MRLKIASLVLLGLGSMGCGGGPGSDAISEMDRAALATELEVREFSSFNPIFFYFINYAMSQGTSLADEGGVGIEGGCPTLTRDGNETRLVGGCTDEEGNRYEGEVHFVAASSGRPHGKLTYKEFSLTATDSCGDQEVTRTTRYDGSMELSGDSTSSKLRINVAMSGTEIDEVTCASTPQTIGYVFEGTIDGKLPGEFEESELLDMTPTTWNGKGQIGFTRHGYVDVELIDELLDFETCATGALSGKAIYTGEKKVELTFHGAETCGTSATWTLDGVDQGELEGVTCSAMGGGTLSGFGLLALGGLLLRRRRSVS